MEYDLHNSVKDLTVITPTAGAAAGASTVGAIIDTRGFESLEYIALAGVITTGSFTFLLEEAPDDGTGNPGSFVTVDSDLVLGTVVSFAVTDDNVTKRQGVISKERFQRLTLVGASTPVGDFAVVAVLGHAQTRPTSDG